MKFLGVMLFLSLAACSGGGSGGSGANGGNGNGLSQGKLEQWQTDTLGQEGHGGDAIVCFSIPLSQALYKVSDSPDSGEHCSPDGSCHSEKKSGPGRGGGSARSGTVWRMTEQGRRSIQSAQPLEQYEAERIAGKKRLLDTLRTMTVGEGYQLLLKPFLKLPGAFNQIKANHRNLGWLLESGIRSQYGLMDINDSGFIRESEIDTSRCKELQAVVRRDSTLWYDGDIVDKFDNAGLILIQLHEEIYAWGKALDEINSRAYNRNPNGRPAHEESVNTRHLLWKVLDDTLTEKSLNDHLKTYGFSAFYWGSDYRFPVSPGHYMNQETCEAEQKFLAAAHNSTPADAVSWMEIWHSRYLMTWNGEEMILAYNFPESLRQLIQYTATSMGQSPGGGFAQGLDQLMLEIQKPETCYGVFDLKP